MSGTYSSGRNRFRKAAAGKIRLRDSVGKIRNFNRTKENGKTGFPARQKRTGNRISSRAEENEKQDFQQAGKKRLG